MPNFSSVALFVQKLFRFRKSFKVIHTNCLMYIKKPNWESVNVNFKDISFLFLLFLSLTLDR